MILYSISSVTNKQTKIGPFFTLQEKPCKDADFTLFTRKKNSPLVFTRLEILSVSKVCASVNLRNANGGTETQREIGVINIGLFLKTPKE